MKFSYIAKDFVKDFQADFGLLQKFSKAAVISSTECYYFRKVYPKVNLKDLPNIVKNDNFGIEIQNMVVKHRIRDSIESGYIVDIWIFDGDILKGRKFSYIVPEFGMFYSPQMEISIYKDLANPDIIHTVAHDEKGFISSIDTSLDDFEEEFSIFIHSIKRYGEPKVVNLFADLPTDIKLDTNLKVEKIYTDNLPAFLLKTDKNAIKQFKESVTFSFEGEKVLKTSVAFLLTLSVIKYINLLEYKREIDNIDIKIQDLTKKIESLNTKIKEGDSQTSLPLVLEALKQDLNIDTLRIIQKILQKLPDRDYIVMYSQEEYKLRISVNSKDPVVTIKALSSIDIFENLKMATAPIKQQDNSFNILIDIDLKKETGNGEK